MKELYAKIGKLLQIERTRREIKLENLASDLKVSEAHLEAIEDGDASRLPSELYFKLFAKSYAEALGIDYEATVEAIEADLSIAEQPTAKSEAPVAPLPDSDSPPASEKPATNGSRRQIKKLLYLIAAVVALFLIVVAVNELFLKQTEPAPAVDSVETTEVEPEEIAPAESDELSDYDWNVTPYSKPAPMTLALLARSQSWATVLADGDTAVYRTLTPGRLYEVTAQYRLRVSVGVPSVVAIELNGQPVNLRNPESGRIASVKIDQVNLEQYLSRPLTAVSSGGGAPRNATAFAGPSSDGNPPGDSI
jgi:cytoskeletal protein RodZ